MVNICPNKIATLAVAGAPLTSAQEDEARTAAMSSLGDQVAHLIQSDGLLAPDRSPVYAACGVSGAFPVSLTIASTISLYIL